MPNKIALTVDELQPVLEPDFNSGSFLFGANPDGSIRKWRMEPLRWKFEKNFRKQVMPMLAETYKPFETLVTTLKQDFISDLSPSFVKAIFDAEGSVDDHLVKVMHSILIAQDKTITEEWVEDNAESREQLMDIIEKQCELHRVMDRLGELLAERFVKLARMMGVEVDLATLKRLWKLASDTLSAKLTQMTTTVDNVTGLSTESLSETGSPALSEQIKVVLPRVG